MIRALTTMVADMAHIGHVNHVIKSRELAKARSGEEVYMIVGIHSDKVVESYKRKPLFTMEERINLMAQCPGVDEILPNAPLDLTIEYLNELKIDFVCGNLMDGESESAKRYNAQYKGIIDAGRFLNVPRTEGISTTMLIQRAEARLKNETLQDALRLE